MNNNALENYDYSVESEETEDTVAEDAEDVLQETESKRNRFVNLFEYIRVHKQ